MRKPDSPIKHTTTDEMIYLENIGQRSKAESVKWLSKLEILQAYKQAAEKRDEWGDINPVAIFKYVDSLIERSQEAAA